MTAPCKDCGASLLWVRTSAGNLCAINPEPDPAGDMILCDGVAYQTGQLYDSPPGPRHRQHASNCPARTPPPVKGASER